MSYDPNKPEFNSDGEALHVLEGKKYWCKDGLIIPPKPGHMDTAEERKAIDYLCSEWDWSYMDVV